MPLVGRHINSFRRASSCGEAMARRRKEERRAGRIGKIKPLFTPSHPPAAPLPPCRPPAGASQQLASVTAFPPPASPPTCPPAALPAGARPALERLGLPAPRGPSPDRPTHQRLAAAGPRRLDVHFISSSSVEHEFVKTRGVPLGCVWYCPPSSRKAPHHTMTAHV